MHRLLLLPVLLLLLPFSVVHGQETGFEQFEQVCASGQSYEECAIKKLNHGLMPPEQATETIDEEVSGWLSTIGQALNGLLVFFTGADNLKDAYLPSPTPNANAESSLNGLLAGPDGYYGTTLPQDEQLPEGVKKPAGDKLYIGPIPIPFTGPINQDEKFFEQSYFPDKICNENGSNCQAVCPVTAKCDQ